MNNDLDGYILHLQPSRSAAGCVLIYTKHTLSAFKQTDLSTTDDEFETIWVEIILKLKIFYVALPIDTLPLAL